MKLKILFLVFVLVLGASCSRQKNIVKKFYDINVPMTEHSEGKDLLPRVKATCMIPEVYVYPPYSGTQIPLRNRSNELQYFSYHEWAVRPAQIFRQITMDYLSAENLFIRVSDRFWNENPDYRLELTIFNMEVIENKKSFEARFNYKFELIHAETYNLTLQQSADLRETLENNDLNLFAEAISTMFQNELEKLAENIRIKLAR